MDIQTESMQSGEQFSLGPFSIESNMDKIFIFLRIISKNHSFDTKIQFSANKKSVERTVAFSFHFK